MDFTCLWSKDAQQKKRKRWTDGIARFSPSTGLLCIWDQDGVKISSTRLKPDEAAVALRDDVDETRVGGISIQIVACVGPEEQQQHRHTSPVDSAGVAAAHNREPLSTAGEVYPDDWRGDPGEVLACTNGARTVRPLSPDYGSRSTPNAVATGGKSKPALGQTTGFKRATLGARRSLPSGAFARNQVSMIEQTNLGDQTTSIGDGGRDDGSDGNEIGPVLKRRAFKRPVPSLTPRALGGLKNRSESSPRSSTERSECVHATAEVSRPDSNKRNELGAEVGSVSKVGLRGGRMGAAGGARRFHAPRSTGTAPAKQGVGPEASVPLVASGGFSTFSSGTQKMEQRVGVSRGDTVATDVSDVELSRVAASSTAGKLDAATNQEDLVLEWRAGNPPQPLKAGGSLTRRLHPHQRDGLKVLWQCLVGRGSYDGRGAILADEMGLGKTATAIALCTCVLRHRRAECLKAVVVCPSSLVKNWANEFRQWCPLGGGAVAVDQAGATAAQMVADFNIGAPARYPILIISYELYRNHGSVINATEGLGLLIADEGHRLKNSAETKTARALKACPAAMRLVMTGTPMQNDLDEFFTMADFVNPGLLGSLKNFRSKTKDVIRGSLPPALEIVVFCRISQRQLSLYERCIAESSATAAFFVDDGAAPGTPLRASFREVLPLISTLRRLCNHPDLVVGNSGGGGLVGAKKFDDGHLREKLPNQVMDDGINDEDSDSDDLAFLLMDAKEGKERGRARSREKENTQANGIGVGRGGCRGPKRSWELLPPAKTGAGAEAGAGIGRGVDRATDTTMGFARGTAVTAARYATGDSGKLMVLEALLRSIRQEFPGDKVVVTSNFTSALDVLVCLAERNDWGFQRLDGGTAPNARQPLVDQFNRAPSGDLFLFFLSARAGGVGLNLIGANRIVLYDSDWNPATDDQAMARVWRLGQTKEVSMYRLVSTGTLEETIYQRQIFKGALYDLIHDANDSGSAPNFTANIDDDRSGRRKASQRNRQMSDGCGQVGGGFSREELKDLFILKTGTSSDTFDKLRRRIPLLRLGDDAHEQLSSPEFDHDDDGSTSRKGWREYNGPSGIADLALRRALHRESPGFGDDCDGVRGVSASAAASGPAVTFVREVKRGGVEPVTTRRENVGKCTPQPRAV